MMNNPGFISHSLRFRAGRNRLSFFLTNLTVDKTDKETGLVEEFVEKFVELFKLNR